MQDHCIYWNSMYKRGYCSAKKETKCTPKLKIIDHYIKITDDKTLVDYNKPHIDK